MRSIFLNLLLPNSKSGVSYLAVDKELVVLKFNGCHCILMFMKYWWKNTTFSISQQVCFCIKNYSRTFRIPNTAGFAILIWSTLLGFLHHFQLSFFDWRVGCDSPRETAARSGGICLRHTLVGYANRCRHLNWTPFSIARGTSLFELSLCVVWVWNLISSGRNLLHLQFSRSPCISMAWSKRSMRALATKINK